MIGDNINCNSNEEYQKLIELESTFLERVKQIKERLNSYEKMNYEN